MWIFMNDAFLSIVAIHDDPNKLLVRARQEGDIKAVFSQAKVIQTDERDYKYRALIKRTEVTRVLGLRISEIDYPNFK